MKIANLYLGDKPVLLAPMEDITDPSFRYLCKHYGADLMYTEFVASEALIRNVEKSFRKLKLDDTERPIGIQLYGHNVDAMVESAKIAEEAQPELIDLNFGCPVKKIANRGAGAGMLRDIPKLIEMTARVVEAVKLPVTVKTRLGWDLDNLIIEDLARQLQDTGIKALTIHGRTRSQMYTGISDWTLIGNVKANPEITYPVIGNGDVDSPERAKEMFDTYGVDAIMIGRATVGRPWIFKEVKHYLKTGEKLPPISLEERVEIAKLHLKKSLEWKGDRTGIFEIRRHFSSYFKGLPNFKQIRLKLVTSTEVDEINKTLDSILVRYKDFDYKDIDPGYFRKT